MSPQADVERHEQRISRDAFDRFIVDLLRDPHLAWPFSESAQDYDKFVEFARAYRILPMIGHQLRSSGALQNYPSSLRQQIADDLKAETAFQMLRDREIQRLAASCRKVGIRPIFFKGSALGKSVYPNPVMRTSVDVDLLVGESQFAETLSLFNSHGYATFAPYRGQLHSNEVVCKRSFGDVVIEFDCHHAINNRPLLARLLPYEEIAESARRSENDDVLIPSNVHSLMIACIHRVAHNNTDDLVWLSDFKYLVTRMSAAEKQEFVDECQRKRICQICLAGIESAAATLRVPELVDLAAQIQAIGSRDEPTSVYLRAGRSPVGDALIRWKTQGSLRKQILYGAELLFPNRAYLAWKYGTHGSIAKRYLFSLLDALGLAARGISQRNLDVDGPKRNGPN